MLASIKGLGEVGYLPDQASFELPPNALTELQNFRMRGGWAEKVSGYVQAFANTAFSPLYVAPYSTATTKYIVSASNSSVYVDDGVNRYNITGTLGSGNNRFTGGVLSGILVLNNGSTSPVYWAGNTGTPCATLTAWPANTSCVSMRPFRYHLVAMNVTKSGVQYPHRVKVSAAAVPGSVPASWDQTDPTVDTVEVDIVGDGVLVDAMPLGDTLILYKERSMCAMQYIGGDFVWSFNPLPDPVGMLAPGCGCVVPGVGHVVLTSGDVVRHAGNGAQSILDGKAKRWLFSTIDQNFYANSFVVPDYKNTEVWICFPEKGYQVCTKALVWNYESNTLSKRDLPSVTYGTAGVINYAQETYANDSIAFNAENVLTFLDGADSFAQSDTRMLMAANTNQILVMDSGTTANGSTYTGYIERTGLHFDKPDQVKHLKRLWIGADGTVGNQLSVYIGSSMDRETAPTYQSPVTFTIGTDEWIDAWTSGRFLAYKISGNSDFRIRSVDMDVEMAGKY